jgi:hypothetical protein
MKMAQKAHKILRSEWENGNKIDWILLFIYCLPTKLKDSLANPVCIMETSTSLPNTTYYSPNSTYYSH